MVGLPPIYLPLHKLLFQTTQAQPQACSSLGWQKESSLFIWTRVLGRSGRSTDHSRRRDPGCLCVFLCPGVRDPLSKDEPRRPPRTKAVACPKKHLRPGGQPSDPGAQPRPPPTPIPPHARGAEATVKTWKAQKVPDPVRFPSEMVTFTSALCFLLSVA